ncbi:MAG: type II toxin-antitoxin system RelE family toxin [Thermoplasmatota archaeon]
MAWGYQYAPSFHADLKGLDAAVASRIMHKLHAIKEDPLRAMKRLKESDTFSLRIGDYRVYAEINSRTQEVTWTAAGHRRNIHDRV